VHLFDAALTGEERPKSLCALPGWNGRGRGVWKARTDEKGRAAAPLRGSAICYGHRYQKIPSSAGRGRRRSVKNVYSDAARHRIALRARACASLALPGSAGVRQRVSAEEVAALDISIRRRCRVCRKGGAAGRAQGLVEKCSPATDKGHREAADRSPAESVRSGKTRSARSQYWPYATTLFDYVRGDADHQIRFRSPTTSLR